MSGLFTLQVEKAHLSLCSDMPVASRFLDISVTGPSIALCRHPRRRFAGLFEDYFSILCEGLQQFSSFHSTWSSFDVDLGILAQVVTGCEVSVSVTVRYPPPANEVHRPAVGCLIVKVGQPHNYIDCVCLIKFWLRWSDGMRCCRSDWPGLFLFCCYQPLCVVSSQSWFGFCFCFFYSPPPLP